MDIYRIFLSICLASHVHVRCKSVSENKAVTDIIKPLRETPILKQASSCPNGQTMYAPTSISIVNYDNWMTCSWIIMAQSGYSVKVTIDNYHIEYAHNCVYDRLIVQTGSREHRLCGEGSYVGYSSGTQMRLMFISDRSITDLGFVADFVQIAANDVPAMYSMDTVGSTLNFPSDASEIMLASHSSGNHYSNRMDYTVTITTMNSGQPRHLELSVEEFSLEYSSNCQYDSLTIYDCAGNQLALWCSFTGLEGHAVSAESCLTIHFYTDGSVTSTGFVFTITASQPSDLVDYQTDSYYNQACLSDSAMSIYVTSGEMEIASPYYGMSQYANNMNCRWIVTAAMYVKVEFVTLDVEQEELCSYDAVSFYDGPTTDSVLIASVCGHQLPPVFTSSGNTMLIQFTSDYVVFEDGFLLTVSNSDVEIHGEDPCNLFFSPGYVTTSGVTLTSPEFGPGSTYPPNSLCAWRIVAPDEYTVTLTFTAFHVENAAGCYYDGVALFDGGLLTDPQLGGPYCGNTNPGVVESYQNIVLFIFYSDYTIQYGGFSVIVTFNPPPTPPPPAPSTTPTTTTSPTPNIGSCGVSAVPPSLSRIVGGQEAVPHSWPWQISLRYHLSGSYYYHICGGSVLSEDWVITAAHCVVTEGVVEAASLFQVVAGEHDLGSWEDSEQFVDVAQVIVAPTYLLTQFPDAALLRLATPLEFNSYVSPICLSSQPVDVGHNCVATGWGDTLGTGSDMVLNEVVVEIFSNGDCALSYGSDINVYTVCAGVHGGGKDTCQGDSGGPLVCEVNGVYELHGLTSFGYGCALAGFPGVYARVTTILDWITEYSQYSAHVVSPSIIISDKSSGGPSGRDLFDALVSRNHTMRPSQHQGKRDSWTREKRDRHS